MHTVKLFFSTLVVCFCFDMVWLGLIAKNLYQNSLSDLLRKSDGALAPNWLAAGLVYFAITIGIVFFALPKGEDSYRLAFLWGGLLGFVIYGVYDFTNYSLLAKWPLNITLIDLVWGMMLCGMTTCIALYIKNWLSS